MMNKKRLLYGILIPLIVLIIVASIAVGYTALHGELQFTVNEPLSWVGSNTFTIDSIYPQEVVYQNFTIANASDTNMGVDLVLWTNPPIPDDIVVDIPSYHIAIPHNGQTSFTVAIAIGKSAVPMAYTIGIEIER